jgi:putative FmdB family regulatory protein
VATLFYGKGKTGGVDNKEGLFYIYWLMGYRWFLLNAYPIIIIAGGVGMPTYDYACSSCGDFEYFQKITDEPLKTCPKCGSAVKRLISKNANIIFKGPGFYITDSRKPDYESKAKAEAGENGKKETKAS